MLNHRNFNWRAGVLSAAVLLAGCATVPAGEDPVAQPQEAQTKGKTGAVPEPDITPNPTPKPADSHRGTVTMVVTEMEREPESSMWDDSVPKPQPEQKPTVDARYGKVSSIIDFGGQPYAGGTSVELLRGMQITVPESNSLIDIIRKAVASTTRDVPAFMDDELPVDGGTADSHDFEDYLPGYKDAVVRLRVGKHFLAINPVSILHAGTAATSATVGTVHQKTGEGWINMDTIGGVSVAYPVVGDESLALYRWKAGENAVKRTGILGVDILAQKFAKEEFGGLHYLRGQIYYLKGGKVYTAETDFSIKLPATINPRWRFF